MKKKVSKSTVSKKKSMAEEKPAPAKKTEVKVTAAKGRPMLTWVGKRPLSQITAFPAQHIESFDLNTSSKQSPNDFSHWKDWPAQYPKGGLLFHGDNKEVLAHLLANGFRGKVKLIYIDPPFDSGADYIRKVSLRGPNGTVKFQGENYTLGEQIQYVDIWNNDDFLQFMFERFLLLKELLSENGSIYLHCDWHKGHYLRCLLDEVFGAENFCNEIIWSHTIIGMGKNVYPKSHETIYWYGKSPDVELNTSRRAVRVPYKDRILKNLQKDKKGFFYTRGRMTRQATDQEIASGSGTKTYVNPESGKIAPDVWDDIQGKEENKISDFWTDIPTYRVQGDDYLGYPTQKNDALLRRIIEGSSEPGDIVMDCFIGSGTTAAIAQKIGRRWIGCDINKGAIQTTAKRLQNIISGQVEKAKEDEKQASQTSFFEANEESDDKSVNPAQLSFSVWRVNDYDLAIQHNEAVNLACEHIGIQRTRIDPYFDGTLGKALVKIIPFGHPLTPLDLDELPRELDARPEEDRSVKLVCLGMELAAQSWIEDWNKLRHKNKVNKIEVIELRTDPKYGKFIKHEPAQVRASVVQKNNKCIIDIEDFISPTIIERLNQQAGLLQPKIDDWRAMVDCIMIDSNYDGKIFNVSLSDIPEKKTDLVQGHYELPASTSKTTVAVKIIDMLGEEVLTIKEI